MGNKGKLEELIKLVDFTTYIPKNENDIVYYYNIFTDTVDNMGYKYLIEFNNLAKPYRTKEKAKRYGNLFREVSSEMESLICKEINSTINNFADVKDINLGDSNTFKWK